MNGIEYKTFKAINGIDINFLAEVIEIEKINTVTSVKNKLSAINGKTYQDADAKSELLYDYHQVIWNNQKLDNKKILQLKKWEKSTYKDWNYYLPYNNIKITSDYIGPSTYWALINGVKNEEVGDNLEICRHIGGHIIWPSTTFVSGKKWDYSQGKSVDKRESINQARGGSDGYYDRIDYTLLDLKYWYDELENKCRYPSEFRLKKVFDGNKEWLSIFKNFPGFIHFFILEDFVDVDNDYGVKDLSTYDERSCEYNILHKMDIFKSKISGRENYLKFMKGNTKAIKLRNTRILNVNSENLKQLIENRNSLE